MEASSNINHTVLKDNSFIVSPPELQNWQALQVFSLFRFTLCLTLLILGHFHVPPFYLGQLNQALFMMTAQAYLSLSVLDLIGAVLKKPDYDLQANVPIFFDIFFIILLMHFSGGLHTGLGLLLVIIVAAHSLLAPMLLALVGAAMASSAILTEQVYTHFTSPDVIPIYSQAGLLGICIFATAIVAVGLKKRMHRMQQLAYSRGHKLATSLKLNTQVVAFMQEGVIVFNHERNIQLINSAALRLLCITPNQALQHFSDLPIRFQQAFHEWACENRDEPFQISKDSSEVRLSGLSLSDDGQQSSDCVVFIHDISKEAQKAQHMKLALLGNLAANIAHEIRNPLSSVSHAAQLLKESPELTKEDSKLVDMIKDNCDRMNTVIKNVLNMSKKQSSRPETLDINNFIKNFLEQFTPPGLPPLQIHFKGLTTKANVYMDPSQLRQMLINLCENGLRYSMRHSNQPKLDIIMHEDNDRQLILINIMDYGSGIDGRDAKHIFEPFYTTENHGSGLGLYISREICQMNGGDIYYQNDDTNQGANFCIQLPLIQEARVYDSA